ncbi:RAMP superfamily protein [Fischerella thermalis CCMEE 5268]|uniref:RAMP superfamily protein n=1 Tax=Fischerella thermalis CCMEE 5268 TaxID=2019662 RepID=A0A2N6KF04_9CYAN|nr:RAMP superfamily CRISPR-associated protein [Fischerella thermalis]PLZ97616.1 RAMP superfamily protein [Fischerella thermalis CCMEE 5268]
MYTGSRLIELLELQHQRRSQSGLFKKDTFTIQWRAKVGSFPHPDVETIVSAGEPCGAWRPTQGRPEDKRNVNENWERLRVLPLNGYIPGASIRGIVRAWAKQRPDILSRMYELLGYQNNDTITAGKIEFLDAWPDEPTKLTLDIVNPQQDFQVYHQGQGKPLSLYTLGNGEDYIPVTVAIRGIPGRATDAEVSEVWGWVQQALSLYGVGSRTASGYGTLKFSDSFRLTPDPDCAIKQFDFSLYSQGSAGPNMQTMELRPSHWRGWLRSWILRFLLGVMSEQDAKKTVGELLGTLEPETRKGCVRLQMLKGSTWGDSSSGQPRFYVWKGKLQISAPKDILNKIILPIIRFAVMVGGVGRGWRRPLHIFHMNNGHAAARGTLLTLTHKIKNPNTHQWETKPYGLPLNAATWNKAYQDWLSAVQSQWPDRVTADNHNISAEVFSPNTCAIYAVPGPDSEPIERQEPGWKQADDAEATRGDGMYLIYQQTAPRNYKRNPDIGGNAGAGNASCSWASIKRVNIPNREQETDCQEIVCLFMGGQTPNSNHVRSHFLRDLGNMNGAVHLFGVQPPTNP